MSGLDDSRGVERTLKRQEPLLSAHLSPSTFTRFCSSPFTCPFSLAGQRSCLLYLTLSMSSGIYNLIGDKISPTNET